MINEGKKALAKILEFFQDFSKRFLLEKTTKEKRKKTMTKKAIREAKQLDENKLVYEFLDTFAKTLDSSFYEKCNFKANLRHCSAHVMGNENYYILISYETPIAIIDSLTGIGYDFLRLIYGYTAISTQYINKFFQDYNCVAVRRFRYLENFDIPESIKEAVRKIGRFF